MARSRLFSWRILRLHLALTFCVVAFVLLANWQFRRALGGNTLSWAYAIEWPLFTVYAFVLWRRLLLDELGVTHGKGPRQRRFLFRPYASWAKSHSERTHQRDIEQEAARQRYNDYLGSISDKERDNKRDKIQ
ncbi:MAG TPA: hypothetical protein VMU99_10910 [Acidimicrobiales bacterium]|nr:hypothetical protein [Acidimicrobiales bacterium]